MSPRLRAQQAVRRGATGRSVTTLKNRLRRWFEASSPGEWDSFGVSANDVFGEQLERAVRVFQARAGLPVNGRPGPDMHAILARAPRPARTPRLHDLAYPGALRRGASGEKVKLLQGWLSLHGAHVIVDGTFGPATETALKQFRRRRTAGGQPVLDRATWAALIAPMVNALTPIEKRAALGTLVLAVARQHLKARACEVGSGPNAGPWVRLYTRGHEGKNWPWCAGFATTCLEQACRTLGVPMPIPYTVSCDEMVDAADGRFVDRPTARVGPGSFFVLRAVTAAERRECRCRYKHTGIVVNRRSEDMTTIEGNTNLRGHPEGIAVMKRIRSYADMDFIVI
jgi:peptidoglycan hydrolase-like protein with peptidoglycan-binding domain